MVKLIPVKYHRLDYPAGINPTVQEVSGVFGKERLEPCSKKLSLHTEFSFGSRNLQKGPVSRYPCLCRSQKNGIPQLWKSRQWAKEFAEYVMEFCGDQIPSILEVHPPFAEYSSLESFLDVYSVFEEQIKPVYREVRILVENRYGTQYQPSPFVFSRLDSFLELSSRLDRSGLQLKMAFDVPQLLSAHRVRPSTSSSIQEMLEALTAVRKNILGIHLWGKGPNGGAHCGDLNSYFRGKQAVKRLLLNSLYRLLDDDSPRYFVPEINSCQADLDSIVGDLLESGFTFV